MHITIIWTITRNAMQYLQRLPSRKSFLCSHELRSSEFRAEQHVGYITLPRHYFLQPKPIGAQSWLSFFTYKILSTYGRVCSIIKWIKIAYTRIHVSNTHRNHTNNNIMHWKIACARCAGGRYFHEGCLFPFAIIFSSTTRALFNKCQLTRLLANWHTQTQCRVHTSHFISFCKGRNGCSKAKNMKPKT